MPNPVEVRVAATAKTLQTIMDVALPKLGQHLQGLPHEKRKALYAPLYPPMSAEDAPLVERLGIAISGLANCYFPFHPSSPVSCLMTPWLAAQTPAVQALAASIGQAGGRLIRLGSLLGETDEATIFAYEDLLGGEPGKVVCPDNDEPECSAGDISLGLYHETPSHIVEVIGSGLPPYALEVLIPYLGEMAAQKGLPVRQFVLENYPMARLAMLRVEAADPMSRI